MAFEYLGRGPAASGGSGWTMSSRLAFKCVACGYVMSGSMRAAYKDADAGRFGSTLGDDAIEVYKVID
ncbi:hypothetical protein [Micromonospora sp. DT47]|uniref:hypothetical protein n=1 Tax=Micromonospora sp. DT47 TaxID=3393431 RepID=UPI003CF52233